MGIFDLINSVVDFWNSLPNWVVIADSSKVDLADIDQIRISFTIFEHKFKEPRIEVR